MEENKQDSNSIDEAATELAQNVADPEQDVIRDEEEDGNVEQAKEALRPVTVRFDEATWEVIKRIANDANVPMAELVRYAVARNLDAYLGTIQFADEEQAGKIRDIILQVFNVLSDIKMDLLRIGVTYDKQAMLSQIDRELAQPGLPLSREKELYHKRQEALSDIGVMDTEQIASMMNQFDSAVKKVGEPMWHILASLPRETA